MKIYEVIEAEFGLYIKMTDSQGKVWWIPTDPANSEYQEYLSSIDTPEPEQE
jgi:hypothetical protein